MGAISELPIGGDRRGNEIADEAIKDGEQILKIELHNPTIDKCDQLCIAASRPGKAPARLSHIKRPLDLIRR
jgi:hypothetical protein